MNERGFTLLEVLTVIAILGVVSGLAFEAYQQTDKAVRIGNHRGDALGATVRFMDRIQDLFRSIDLRDPVKLAEKSAEFTCWDKNSKVSVRIEERDSGIVITQTIGSDIKKSTFPGSLSFAYWNGQSWVKDWLGGGRPAAVSVSFTPAPIRGYRMEPFYLSLTLTGAAHSTENRSETGSENPEAGGESL